ncbi:hypothetical protein PABY_06380 [Pyrodictium abyssi]|uniref:Uncharacterized protein n=1 Tax=Pyrodictium abyssi TaxID=54256 RepID=A0ABN6ZLE4_9CREN|nr:hypothetical protein PABY_06380 [Pyrodictium abyssi]
MPSSIHEGIAPVPRRPNRNENTRPATPPGTAKLPNKPEQVTSKTDSCATVARSIGVDKPTKHSALVLFPAAYG